MSGVPSPHPESVPVATIRDVRRVATAFFGFGLLLGLVIGVLL